MSTTISRNEILQRASRFSLDWKDERRERAEKDTFWNEFLGVFGVKRREVATFEHTARKLSTSNVGFIDMFWPGVLAVEHKSRGENLDDALVQLKDYLWGKIAGTASSVTGAAIFIGGALLGSLIDRQIIDTVTPFGVGFLIYSSLALIAVWFGRE